MNNKNKFSWKFPTHSWKVKHPHLTWENISIERGMRRKQGQNTAETIVMPITPCPSSGIHVGVILAPNVLSSCDNYIFFLQFSLFIVYIFLHRWSTYLTPLIFWIIYYTLDFTSMYNSLRRCSTIYLHDFWPLNEGCLEAYVTPYLFLHWSLLNMVL